MNLDTQSSDSSEEEIRDSGRLFQSLIVWGKKLYILDVMGARMIIFVNSLNICPEAYDFSQRYYKALMSLI